MSLEWRQRLHIFLSFFLIKSTGIRSLPSLTSLVLRLPSAEKVESGFFWFLLHSIDFLGPLNMFNFIFLWPPLISCSEQSLVLFELSHLSFFLLVQEFESRFFSLPSLPLLSSSVTGSSVFTDLTSLEDHVHLLIFCCYFGHLPF